MTTLRDVWAGGGSAVGVWLSMPSVVSAETVARCGADFVCADLQHGAIDDMAFAGIAQGVLLGGSRPLARVAWNDMVSIGRALDMGAEGVIVPMVNSADEAAAAVAAVRYPPAGQRSFGPLMGGMREARYREVADDRLAVIPMIETAAALRHLDDILATPGIDAVYVGPDDLGLSLGLPLGTRDESPVFADAVASILAACRRHGVVPGIHATGGWAARRLEQGFRMMAAISELSALQAAVSQALNDARSQR